MAYGIDLGRGRSRRCGWVDIARHVLLEGGPSQQPVRVPSFSDDQVKVYRSFDLQALSELDVDWMYRNNELQC